MKRKEVWVFSSGFVPPAVLFFQISVGSPPTLIWEEETQSGWRGKNLQSNPVLISTPNGNYDTLDPGTHGPKYEGSLWNMWITQYLSQGIKKQALSFANGRRSIYAHSKYFWEKQKR